MTTKPSSSSALQVLFVTASPPLSRRSSQSLHSFFLTKRRLRFQTLPICSPTTTTTTTTITTITTITTTTTIPSFSATTPRWRRYNVRPLALPPSSTTTTTSPTSSQTFASSKPCSAQSLSNATTTTTHSGNIFEPITKLLNKLSPRFLLCLVPLCWATFVICVKLLSLLPVSLSPASFNTLRLFVSSLIFLPTLRKEFRNVRSCWPGIELGLLIFCANIFQLVGLEYTTASRCAFLNQMSTIFVPLVAAALRIEPLTNRIAIGSCFALIGIFFLTCPTFPLAFLFQSTSTSATTATAATATLTAISTTTSSLSSTLLTSSGSESTSTSLMKTISSFFSSTYMGDLLQLVSAAFTTAYVLRVSHFSKSLPSSRFIPIGAVKVSVQALMSFIWLLSSSLWTHFSTSSSPSSVTNSLLTIITTFFTSCSPFAILINVLLVFWAGAIVSAASTWLQTKGQAKVSASEAAVLYASQPLWTGFFAFVLLRERLQIGGIIGAGLIVMGAVLSSTGKKKTA